jgi:hypothetical protein
MIGMLAVSDCSLIRFDAKLAAEQDSAEIETEG